jgi:hypothetical protein
MECLQAQGVLPRYHHPWTTVIRNRAQDLRWHVSGWGRAVRLDDSRRHGSWHAVVEFLAGEPNELVLAGVDRPERVWEDGNRLDELDVKAAAERIGWRYDETRQALLVRFEHAERAATLRVDW